MGGAEAPNRQPVSRRIASPHLGTHLIYVDLSLAKRYDELYHYCKPREGRG